MSSNVVGSQHGLPKDKCWEVLVNDELIPHDQVETVVLENKAMKLSWHYGRVGDASYAQGVLKKPGGSTVVPICCHPKAGLLVGVVQQQRPLQNPDEPVLNVPRGFRLPQEAFDQTAGRELKEELGGLVRRIKPVPGCGVHMDNALITYSTGSCGDFFFYVEVDPSEINQTDGEWKFVEGVVNKPTAQDEKILGCTFISYQEVRDKVEDAYTRLALLGALDALGRIIA